MTIKELKELREKLQWSIHDEDSNLDWLDGEAMQGFIELIDTEIARQSVTDEDVREAIEWLNQIKANALNMLDWENDLDLVDGYKTDIKKVETILQQMQKEPCEYCKSELICFSPYAPKVIDEDGFECQGEWEQEPVQIKYCPNCGKLR